MMELARLTWRVGAMAIRSAVSREVASTQRFGRFQLARIVAVMAVIMQLGCAASPDVQSVDAVPEPEWHTPESLERASAPALPLLDIGVVLFDPGVSDDDVSPLAAVRRLEGQLLAAELRDALQQSNQWGVVRLVPSVSALTPIALQTRIVFSDGRDLILDVTARDAMGTLWFDQRIAHRSTLSRGAERPLGALFNVISNRLLAYWRSLSVPERQRFLDAAGLMYAQSLVPEAFSDMVALTEEGWQLRRLPAEGDPMVARVTRVRNQEYLFCDTVDEQYTVLQARVGPTYALWRQATLEQAEWLEQYERRASSRAVKSSDSEFSRMHAQYAAYRSFRIQEQALFELAEALDNESQPTVLQTEDRVVSLEGSLASRYDSWRELLREIYLLEQGQAAW
jgi:hypothetical protein